jgi:transposase
MDNMIIRDHLGKVKKKVDLDVEKAYRLIDSGMSVEQAAEKLGVSVSTLYRRHREYQKQAQFLNTPVDDPFPHLPE